MLKNVGGLDRLVRLVLGIPCLIVGLWPMDGAGGAGWGIVVSIVGLILLLTAATGSCLLYRIPGISTRD